MTLQTYRIMTFDVVGTLIDFEAGVLRYIRDVGGAVASDLNDQMILEAFAVSEDVQHQAHPNLPFPAMMEPIYRDMAEKLNLPLAKDEAKNFRQSIPEWPAFPDAVDALGRLKERFRLVALTNSDNWALGHFKKTLGEPFHDTVTAEDVGCNKPDPQVFAYCRGRQSHLGFRLGDYLHVAQSQYHDICVAKRLGFATCWIERRRGQEGFGATPVPDKVAEPTYHFTNLTELADAALQ